MHVYVAQTDYLPAVTAPHTVSAAYPESYPTGVSTSGDKFAMDHLLVAWPARLL